MIRRIVCQLNLSWASWVPFCSSKVLAHQRVDLILLSEVTGPGNSLRVQGPRCSQQHFFLGLLLYCRDSFLSWCRCYQIDQRQKYVWMKHQNKAFKCLFGCTEASSASVNSFSKRIWGNNKNRLLLRTRLLSEISISMWPWWLLCDWCYLSLSSCSVAGSTSTVQPWSSEAWSHPKYTPVFFIGGGAKSIWPLELCSK